MSAQYSKCVRICCESLCRLSISFPALQRAAAHYGRRTTSRCLGGWTASAKRTRRLGMAALAVRKTVRNRHSPAPLRAVVRVSTPVSIPRPRTRSLSFLFLPRIRLPHCQGSAARSPLCFHRTINRAFMRRRVARLAWRTWMTALREARADAARALKSMKFFLVSGSRRAFMVRTHAHIRAQMRARAPRCEHARTCAGLEASRGAPEEVPRLVRRAAACDAGTTQICAPRSLRQSIALTLSFRNGFCPLRSCSS